MKNKRLLTALLVAMLSCQMFAQQNTHAPTKSFEQATQSMAQAYISLLNVFTTLAMQQQDSLATNAAHVGKALTQNATQVDSAMTKNAEQLEQSLDQMVGHMTQAGIALSECAEQMVKTIEQNKDQQKKQLAEGAKTQSEALFDVLQSMLSEIKAATDAAIEDWGKH